MTEISQSESTDDRTALLAWVYRLDRAIEARRAEVLSAVAALDDAYAERTELLGRLRRMR